MTTIGIIYKIRSRKTGLFSKGGSRPSKGSWSKNGKIWPDLRSLHLHLVQHRDDHNHPCKEYLEQEAEVVEYEIVERKVTPIENYELRKKK